MAVLVRRYRMECGRSDMDHMKHFWRLTKTLGFTVTLVPGMLQERVGWMLRWRRRRRVVTIDMAAGWQLAAGLDDGWIDVERGEDGEEMQEDDEGEEEEGNELSELIYDMARMTANFVVKSRQRAGSGRTMGVFIGDVGRAQALRLRHAQFFFLLFMATFSVFFVESGRGGGIGARDDGRDDDRHVGHGGHAGTCREHPPANL
ncbi:hypothetical protein B0H14DRAFT_2653513 [Mycena olivaceomarginata]|nr:hypothetical protein B0H14DRAFT_2653513 [Mycena olivaceomarginata]